MVAEFIHTPVSEEIKRIVASAKGGAGCISVSESAAWVSRVYPNCGLTERELADQIILAAAKAGVAVEIGKPEIGDLRSPVASSWAENKPSAHIGRGLRSPQNKLTGK